MNKGNVTKAFTGKADGIAKFILSEVHFAQSSVSDATRFVARALWDTGATQSCIKSELAISSGLIPSGKTQMTHAGGISDNMHVFRLDLFLPNKFIVPGVNVIEMSSPAMHFDFIIGMDIICLGDFAITNIGGKTSYSFRMPSCECIDFVTNRPLTSIPVRKEPKVKPNDPCPCGSGKKYKKCCGQ